MPAIRTEHSPVSTLPYTVIKPTPDSKPKGKTKASSNGSKGGCDKTSLITLVLKQTKPDWVQISSAMTNKTHSQLFDLWRKTVFPNLITGKEWSNESTSWTSEDKIKVVLQVLDSVKIDFGVVAQALPGRTKSQIYDLWRKSVLPKLKKGEVVA